jgi:[ribosomal protein S18]-alanine N-acetyltransferase
MPSDVTPSPSVVTPLSLSDYALVPLAEAHIDGVMAIESCSFGVHHWSTTSFRNELNNQMAYYAVLQRLPSANEALPFVLGYTGCWLVMDEGHITTLASHPAYRGLSLGEVLLQHLLAWLRHRKAQTATLEVRESNLVAQNLYYTYQFTTCGWRPRYYQDNDEAAVLMRSPLLGAPSSVALWLQRQQRLRERWCGKAPLGWCEH